MSSHESPRDRVTGEPNGRWLTPGVGAVGAASFFSDTGHEVTTSVLPTFLTGTLGASAAALGVIDGISDALIGVMKLVGGPLANNPGRRGRSQKCLGAADLERLAVGWDGRVRVPRRGKHNESFPMGRIDLPMM
jgi:hypothetical protein